MIESGGPFVLRPSAICSSSSFLSRVTTPELASLFLLSQTSLPTHSNPLTELCFDKWKQPPAMASECSGEKQVNDLSHTAPLPMTRQPLAVWRP